MNTDRWHRVEELYHAALARLESDRLAFLGDACGGDLALLQEVKSLLAQPASGRGFLDDPAVAVAAQMARADESVLTGKRIGIYQVEARIGVGGMGEVYRARDTKLGRDVALKILPPHFASDPDRLTRFDREARFLASFNHPHIGAIYGLEDADGVRALVLELVDGETLADRISRGPLALTEALIIAGQIAQALDAAHEKGIVHRDLKPANIKVAADGVVKVLDFGLAKAMFGDVSIADVTKAPTVTIGTRDGVILGTAGYMSPEQARGRTVDKRTDIWAFGCVLYGALTGQTAFARDTMSDTIAAVLEREPDWSLLPPETPASIARLLRRCLDKDAKRRLRDIGEARIEIEETLTAIGDQCKTRASEQPITRRRLPIASMPVAAARTGRRRWIAPVVAAAIAVAAIGVTGVLMLRRPAPAAPLVVSRFTLAPAADAPLVSVGGFDVLISPDATRIVYLGKHPQGGRALYLREIGGLEARPISGTELPDGFANANPFFSPDGASVGFRSPGKGIMRVLVSGGAPAKITDDQTGFVGAAWGVDDTLVAALIRAGSASGLYRVSARGGSFEPITKPVAAGVIYVAPTLLPGGRSVLVEKITLNPGMSRVAVVDLDSGDERILIEQASNPMYLSSGHLVFGRGTTLMAVPFDPDTRTVQGTPVSVIENVWHPSLVSATDYSLSSTGTLIYVPSETAVSGMVAPVWVDRSGRVTAPAVGAPLNNPRDVRLSPDGRRLAVVTGPLGDGTLSVHDLTGRPPLPLGGRDISLPLWSPDGARVFFTSNSGGGTFALYVVSADGSSREPQLVPTGREAGGEEISALFPKSPWTWLRDGRLIFVATNSGGERGFLAIPQSGSNSPDVILGTPEVEDSPATSPDGRWLAYRSMRTGRGEIWVMGVDGAAPVRVSQNGGQEPIWSRDGREIFYLEGNKMMVVGVESGAAFTFRPATVLFEQPFFHSDANSFIFVLIRSYDIGPDGRFLMIPPVSQTAVAAQPTNIVVVQNWIEELKRLVPTR